MQEPIDRCLTCYGSGETVADGGPQACPDCFGEGKALSRGTKLEWRLRALEKSHCQAKHEASADVLWLVNELRVARETLLRIFARCADADEADVTARDVRYQANEALGLYEMK
jgi:hypothetical protein